MVQWLEALAANLTRVWFPRPTWSLASSSQTPGRVHTRALTPCQYRKDVGGEVGKHPLDFHSCKKLSIVTIVQKGNKILKQQQNKRRGGRDVSMVKGTGCSCRGPEDLGLVFSICMVACRHL